MTDLTECKGAVEKVRRYTCAYYCSCAFRTLARMFYVMRGKRALTTNYDVLDCSCVNWVCDVTDPAYRFYSD